MASPVAGGNLPAVKRQNRSAVLRVLLMHGPISRLDVGRITGMHPATVSNIVAELISAGYVSEVGETISTRAGRRPILIALRSRSALVGAIDIRFTSVAVALSDIEANVVARTVLPLAAQPDPESTLDDIASALRGLLAASPGAAQSLLGVGVGCIGLADHTTGVNRLAASLGWRDVPIAQHLQARLGLPVVVDNNVRIMALGEKMFGLGKHVDNLIVVHVGWGIGAGFIIQHELFRGSDDYAGELGHITSLPDGEPCSCGGRGCLETVSSGRVMLAQARAAAQAEPDSPLGRLLSSQQLTLETVLQAAAAGDERAQAIVRRAARYLGLSIGNLASILNPELVIVAGAVLDAGEVFLAEARSAMEEASYVARASGKTAVAFTRFGLNAGFVGAASLALDRFFYNPPAAEFDARPATMTGAAGG